MPLLIARSLRGYRGDMVELSKAISKVKVNGQGQKIKVKKLKCSELLETHEYPIKNFCPYKSLLGT